MTRRVVLRQLVVRHGDRAPALNFSQTDREAAVWAERLPADGEVEALQRRFPVASAATRPPIDEQGFPFGHLTRLGVEQLTSLGHAMASRLSSPSSCPAWRRGTIGASSSNYTRTQRSAQAFLHGLLPEPGQGGSGAGDEGEAGSRARKGVAVHVSQHCVINPFDTGPTAQILAEKISGHAQGAEFRNREDRVAPLRQLLVDALPVFSADPESFRWVKSYDFFACHGAHGDDLSIVPDSEAASAEVLTHMAWRFQTWYRDPEILTLVSGPLLEKLQEGIRQAAAASSAPREAGEPACEFQLIAAHDVTVLALHHALSTAFADLEAWWPQYASFILFETDSDFQTRIYASLPHEVSVECQELTATAPPPHLDFNFQ